MTFVPVPDTVQVNLVYLWDQQQVENTLYFHNNAGADSTNVPALLEQINTWAREELLPLLNTSLALIQIIGRILDAVDSLSFISTTSLPAAGSTTGTSVANNVSYVLSLRTALAGRSFRGRNYVPGLSESVTTHNHIDAGERTALLDAYETLRAGVAEPDGWEMVVVSRFHDNAPRVTGLATPVVAITTFDDVLDSQRRRLPGRGN